MKFSEQNEKSTTSELSKMKFGWGDVKWVVSVVITCLVVFYGFQMVNQSDHVWIEETGKPHVLNSKKEITEIAKQVNETDIALLKKSVEELSNNSYTIMEQQNQILQLLMKEREYVRYKKGL